ncbi:flagellar protein FlgN [Salimicrobium halophilum]|uniref:FlgN protein n=1 Tax=Salimicrobium halophilum TaxID=86666 RepID=A0A1G8RZM5_9BACI|nr:flagellar protein FlgN [Salimicrobium halophilum]SDJ22406.1 FlgN protein [Salimicrobium halophilum]
MIEPIISDMKRLVKLHKSLLNVSKEKTEALKSNDTTKIQQLGQEERKHIQAIEKVEKSRQNNVAAWYEQEGIRNPEPTISDVLERLEGEEHQKLNAEYEAMILVLADLKNQERLNAELTQQSLQFINLSLDLLQPSLSNMNYGGEESSDKPKRSVFDSKA